MIKRQMALKSITQEQLAVSLSMTQGGLAHWLNGKRQPPFEKLAQIADALGMDKATLGAALLDAGTDLLTAPAPAPPRPPPTPKPAPCGLFSAIRKNKYKMY